MQMAYQYAFRKKIRSFIFRKSQNENKARTVEHIPNFGQFRQVFVSWNNHQAQHWNNLLSGRFSKQQSGKIQKISENVNYYTFGSFRQTLYPIRTIQWIWEIKEPKIELFNFSADFLEKNHKVFDISSHEMPRKWRRCKFSKLRFVSMFCAFWGYFGVVSVGMVMKKTWSKNIASKTQWLCNSSSQWKSSIDYN